MKEMDFFQESDPGRQLNGHDLILSNFTDDGATICGRFIQIWELPIQQRLDGFLQKETGGLPSPKGDVVHRAAIAQDSLAVEDKDVRSRHGFVTIGDDMPGIDQDQRDLPQLGGLCHEQRRLITIRVDGQKLHIPLPPLEQTQDDLVGARRMRTFCRPKIKDQDFPPMIAWTMQSALDIGQFEIRSRLMKFHARDYIK